ncbi:MAG TPA: hypothetical protein VIG88_00810 [Lysobacter sp.]
MIRKLLIPLAATALLAGCVTTAPYGYRGGGQGDYYYGAPSVDYRYRGAYPGYGYGSPYYGPYRSGISVWGRYGSPYYYGSGYYGPGYYGYPRHYYPRPVVRPGHGGPRVDRPDGAPWRNPGGLVRRPAMDDGARPMPRIAQPDGGRPALRARDGGSSMGEMIRRARRDADQQER